MPAALKLRVLVVYLVGVAVFLVLAWVSQLDSIASINRSILMALRTGDELEMIGPAKLHGLARDLTALGEVTLWVLLYGFVLVYLLLCRAWFAAVWLLVLLGGVAALGNGLKLLFARARPDFLSHGAATSSYSFPSLHAMTAIVLCLCVAWWVNRHQPSRGLRAYTWSVAGMLVLLVSLTRVYLGVHWPTDVLAGWVAGGLWAMTMILLAKRWLPLEPAADPALDAGVAHEPA